MSNIILGSGITGLLSKFILGPEWKVIPFYKSRFFSFNPALDDNFIIRDDKLDPFIDELKKTLKTPVFLYNRYYSVQGDLYKEDDKGLTYTWLYKVFGSEIPPQAEAYCKNRMRFFVYDIRVNALYELLMKMYIEELKIEAAQGKVTEIGDHYIVRNNNRLDFDKCVSTIPLNVLYELMGKNHNLKSKTLHYLHVQTDKLNFEGANQLLVVDNYIDFFKVSNVAPGRYLFYCNNEIPNPGSYLMSFMQDFDILDGTSIDNVIPLGISPKLDQLESKDIFCVGSSAQWDWCMDISSCILRLLRYANRGENAAKMNIMNRLV